MDPDRLLRDPHPNEHRVLKSNGTVSPSRTAGRPSRPACAPT